MIRGGVGAVVVVLGGEAGSRRRERTRGHKKQEEGGAIQDEIKQIRDGANALPSLVRRAAT